MDREDGPVSGRVMDDMSFGILGVVAGAIGREELEEDAKCLPVVTAIDGTRMHEMFGGVKMVLVSGTDSLTEGAIATPEDYASGNDSLCHLFPDGRIMRYGAVIGDAEDIVITEP